MKIGMFTEFSYAGKSERQAYAEILEQIALADQLGYDFFSTTESFGKDEFSCSPFPLGLYVAAAQTLAEDSFSYRHHQRTHAPSGDLGQPDRGCRPLTEGRIMVGLGRAILGIESRRHRPGGKSCPI
jgi:hypothetical protein